MYKLDLIFNDIGGVDAFNLKKKKQTLLFGNRFLLFLNYEWIVMFLNLYWIFKSFNWILKILWNNTTNIKVLFFNLTTSKSIKMFDEYRYRHYTVSNDFVK